MGVGQEAYTSATQAGQMADDYELARKDVPSVGKDIYVENLTEGGAIIVAERATMQSKDYYSLSPGSNGEVSQRDIQCLNRT